nr:glycosyltransferase family 8 protein [Helicobacter aurati]
MNNPSHSSYLLKTRFIFHIISDYIASYHLKKLRFLESFLNISIQTHIIDSNSFQNLVPWGEGQNYTTYYRLKIASLLPQHIDKCIYLDCDMILNADIRELYAIALQEHICAVVGEERTFEQPMVALPNNEHFSIKTKYSFNAGLLLLNLKKWREHNIESKLFALLQKVVLTDQDALNIVFNDNIIMLDTRWNCFPVLLQQQPSTAWHHIFKDEANEVSKPTTSLTRAEYEEVCKEAKIIHFGGPKPWQKKAYDFPDIAMWNLKRWYFRLWWINAACTPFYRDISWHILELDKRGIKNRLYDFIKLPDKIQRLGRKYLKNLMKNHNIKKDNP